MLICNFADTVVVPFPFVDMAVAKRRPAVAISGSLANAATGQTVLAMITTAAGSSWTNDIRLQELDAAGLRHESSIRWKVFTLPNNLIVRKLGSLGAPDRAAFAAALRDLRTDTDRAPPQPLPLGERSPRSGG